MIALRVGTRHGCNVSRDPVRMNGMVPFFTLGEIALFICKLRTRLQEGNHTIPSYHPDKLPILDDRELVQIRFCHF